MVQHTVESGESLYKISEKYFGTGIRHVDIYELNQSIIGPNPNDIRAGMTLSLPSDEDERIHEVEEGETLWSISKKYLGSGKRHAEIYELNSEAIGPDANVIKPGQLLVLPRK